ncbi:MAG TPA: hypothetical protein VFQ25_09140 [Ktedonobacterales bacterium]|nr:hypothetical protein [Ktedonobacterales bacterium]
MRERRSADPAAFNQSQAVGRQPTGLRWALWRQWTLANALAEAVGLGATLLAGLLVFSQVEPRVGPVTAALLGVALAALVEGSVVGTAQWLVLRAPLAGLRWRRWAVATAVGAVIAWALGMTPSVVMALAGPSGDGAEVQEPEGLMMYALAAGLGLVAGPVLAVAQWWVLRAYLPRAGWWIPANACAWAVGMMIVFWGISFVPASGITVSVAFVLVGCVILAGAAVGAIHGLALIWLLRERDRRMAA